MDNSEDCIMIVQDSQIVFASEHACMALGISCNPGRNPEFASFIHCDDLDSVIEICRHPINNCTQRVRLVSKDGENPWCVMKFVRGLWNGKPGVIVFFHDIAGSVKMPGDIMHIQRMEAISVLSGGIAHEFNNILAAIMGNAELGLMELPENHPGREEFRQILESGLRATELVKQVLSMTRGHKYGNCMVPLSLPPLIKESVRLLKTDLPDNITVLIRMEPGLYSVRADAAQIYQIFMILCKNAAAYALEQAGDSGIEICLENTYTDLSVRGRPGKADQARYVKLSVKPDGFDMGSETEPGVSEPCFTAKPHEKSKGSALTQVLEIIHKLGGYIAAGTQDGKRLCFSVFLPAHDGKDAAKSIA